MKDERIVTKRVTQKMRDDMTAMLGKAIERQGFTDYGQFAISNSLIMTMYNEKLKHDNQELNTDLNEFARMLNDSYEEEVIREYVALKQHLTSIVTVDTRVMLIRGLHQRKRNRAWMDPNDPVSVRNNTVLLSSIIYLRDNATKMLLDDALEYTDAKQSRHYVQSFRDPECVDLLLDHPEQAEALIDAMLERGYKDGMTVFREMIVSDTPALSKGLL